MGRRFHVTVREVRERTYEVEVEDGPDGDPRTDPERAARYRVLTQLEKLHAIEDRYIGLTHPINASIKEVVR